MTFHPLVKLLSLLIGLGLCFLVNEYIPSILVITLLLVPTSIGYLVIGDKFYSLRGK